MADQGPVAAQGEHRGADVGEARRADEDAGSLSIGNPASRAASVRLGVTWSASASIPAGNATGGAGAGLRMVTTPAVAADAQRFVSGVDGNLQPDEQDVGVGQCRREAVEALGRVVGEHARGEGDAILTGGVDEDDADHRRPGSVRTIVAVDALVRPQRLGLLAERVRPTAVHSTAVAPRRATATA